MAAPRPFRHTVHTDCCPQRGPQREGSLNKFVWGVLQGAIHAANHNYVSCWWKRFKAHSLRNARRETHNYVSAGGGDSSNIPCTTHAAKLSYASVWWTHCRA
eukprot:3932949-Pyramimonas_sp.AAC.1